MRKAKTMVRDADRLAQALLDDARVHKLPLSELIQVVDMALRILRMLYPGTGMDVVNLAQQAEAVFLSVTKHATKN